MTKRQKFITTSLVLSLGFLCINFLENQNRYWAIAVLTLVTTFLFFWSLIEGLGLNATLVTLVLPTLYSLGVGLFWFLLPATIFARLPIVILYGFGIYALCLTTNIFTVSAIRTIALVRAARGVGFVLTLFTFFLLFDAVLSIKASIVLMSILIFIVSFPLFLQGFWQSSLDTKISPKLFQNTLVSSLILVEIALLLYFWPVSVVVGSIFLTVGAYVLLGLGEASLEERLFKQTVREYLIIAFIVFLAMFLVTHWGE